MKFYLGIFNTRGYLQLDLCVALENSIDSNLNAYAVLTVFMQTSQFTNFATQKKNYSDNHSERAYKQGTTKVKGLTNKVLKHVEATEGR